MRDSGKVRLKSEGGNKYVPCYGHTPGVRSMKWIVIGINKEGERVRRNYDGESITEVQNRAREEGLSTIENTVIDSQTPLL